MSLKSKVREALQELTSIAQELGGYDTPGELILRERAQKAEAKLEIIKDLIKPSVTGICPTCYKFLGMYKKEEKNHMDNCISLKISKVLT